MVAVEPRGVTTRIAVTVVAVTLLFVGSFDAGASGSGERLEGKGTPMPVVGSAFTILGAHSPERALSNLAAAGVELVRQDFPWHRIETEPGTFDFSAEEALVQRASAHGIEVLPILAYGHPHYSTLGGIAERSGAGGGLPPFGVAAAHHFPPDPANLDAFERFARKAAARFSDRIDSWEIWNEPNVGWRFWPPHEDPAAYGALLRAGSKGVRDGDPTSEVSLGGLFFPEIPPGLPEQGAVRFLRNMYQADPDIGAAIDVAAWHPYPYPFVAPEVVLPFNTNVPGSADAIRDVLSEHGDGGKDLWVTELGWPTHQEYGVSPERQAAYLARSFALLWAEGVESIVWYTYADGPNAEHNQEDAFGLFTNAGEPKPSYRSLETFTSLLADKLFVGSRAGELKLKDPEHALEFRGRGTRVTMLWASPETLVSDYGYLPESDYARTIELSVRGRATVVSMTGKVRMAVPRRGRIEVEITPFPTYVLDHG